ncbi:MAG: GIY-YIG nuclease family protein [Ignavibacteriae bacterium]|nr:GIY-YIG nuclease family protein [Ignavibacteriota bacterium]
MPFVYILRSAEGLIHIGCSADVAQSVRQHNQGRIRWTSAGSDWQVQHIERFQNMDEAQAREAWLNTRVGREQILASLFPRHIPGRYGPVQHGAAAFSGSGAPSPRPVYSPSSLPPVRRRAARLQ